MLLNIIEILILTAINASSVSLVIILLANSFNNRLYRWFIVMTISIIGWVNFAYLGYAQINPFLATTFYRLNGAFVAIFLFAEYMFYIECFLGIVRTKLRWLMFSLSLLFTVLILFTNTVMAQVVWQGWGNEIIFGPANDFFGLFALLTNFGLVIFLIVRYFKLHTTEKRKVVFFLIGTFLFIFSNLAFNVILPPLLKSARYQHLGDYSAVVFLIFTAFAMLRRSFLDVKVALAAFLISIIGTLLIIDILVLSSSLPEQGVKVIIFIFFIVISVILVRSVLNEMKQKEELILTNKALDKSNQRYMDLANEQKDIIDVMGHEIRTPLTAIIQEVKLQKQVTFPNEEKYENGTATAEEYKKAMALMFDTFKTIDKASAHQLSLVTDMLETARLDKERFELNYTTFDIVELVKTNVELMKKTATSQIYDINFATHSLSTGAHMIEADDVRIAQAIQALISNAMKYGINPETGKSIIDISLQIKDRMVLIAVKDNGLGIAAEDIAKLGKKFVRLDPHMTGNLKRPGGTGLGLFVVKGIVEHHYGHLTIESAGVGKGSTFSITFPVKKPA